MFSLMHCTKGILEYAKRLKKYGDLSVLDTPTFFYGMRLGKKSRWKLKQENIDREIGGHRTAASRRDKGGLFELNGQPGSDYKRLEH